MKDIREIILVFLFVVISSASARDDVEVFNPNFNRRQTNARNLNPNLIYRVYEVIPPRVSEFFGIFL